MSTPPVYEPTVWVDVPDASAPPAGAVALAASALNHLEQGVAAATTAARAGGSVVHVQSTPSASWVVPNTLGRVCGVDVYIAGELVETDVITTTSTVAVIFPSPVSGTAVLT